MLASRFITHAPSFQSVVAIFSGLLAVATILWCAGLGFEYAHEMHPWCGTGCERVFRTLVTDVPLALLVLKLCCLATRGAPKARIVVRCSVVSAALAWGTVLVGIHLF
jgi:hypothetical protein